MKYSCVIFDLDGTLLDTLGDLAAAVNAALEAKGHPVRTIDEVRRFVGNGVKNLVIRALPEGADAEEVESTLTAFKEYYNAHLSVHTLPYPGIPELLERLRAAGVKVGVNSNKYDAALQFLCGRHLNGLYDLALGETESLPRKPSPAAALSILERLDCKPEDAAYVGDSGVDIQTARNGGMAALSVSWGFRSEEELKADKPDALFRDVKDLERYLLDD